MCNKTKAKVVLFTFNFLFWAAGVAMLGFGIWMKVDPEVVTHYMEFLTRIEKTDPLVSYVAILFIAIGAFAVFVGFLGLCGAYNEKKPMLALYSGILIIFMIAELAAVVVLIVYRNKVDETLQEEQLKKTFGNDRLFKDVTETVLNLIQSELHCCGVFGFNDYKNSSWWISTKAKRNQSADDAHVPDSCCVKAADGGGGGSGTSSSSSADPPLKNRSRCQSDALNNVRTGEYLHVMTCLTAVQGWIKTHTMIMVVLAVGIFAFELFGTTAACCLCLLLSRESSSDKGDS